MVFGEGEKIKNIYKNNSLFNLMKFEIDMSGCDIFENGTPYGSVIGISDYNGMIRGFQLNQELVENLKSNWQKGKYFCKYSKRGLGFFKAMVYSAIICSLFESIKNPINVDIEICRDFRWHENNIEQRLKKLLKKKLGIQVNSIRTKKLPDDCDIDNYVYLMFKDKYNLLSTYVNLSLKDIEKFLL